MSSNRQDKKLRRKITQEVQSVNVSATMNNNDVEIKQQQMNESSGSTSREDSSSSAVGEESEQRESAASASASSGDEVSGGENEDSAESRDPLQDEKSVLQYIRLHPGPCSNCKCVHHSSSEPLPEGWLVVHHDAGLPVYVHRGSGVCTLAKPYSLGEGGVRGHEIPITSYPCLECRGVLSRGKAREQQNESAQHTEHVDNEEGSEENTASNSGRLTNGMRAKRRASSSQTETDEDSDQSDDEHIKKKRRRIVVIGTNSGRSYRSYEVDRRKRYMRGQKEGED